MIYLAVVRVAQCEICSKQFYLEGGEHELPARCLHCGSSDWQYGPESVDSKFIRQQFLRVNKVLNRGITRPEKQRYAKQQFRRFKKEDGGKI